MTGETKSKIVWDMDPGIDDAIALMLGLKAGIRLVGITTVAGNVEVDKTTNNACRIMKFMKREISVGRGLDRPLVRELETCPHIHGSDGLGNCGLPSPSFRKVGHFMEIWRKLPSNTIALCTGPLTNVAVALLSVPDLRHRLREIVVMGGAMNLTEWGSGNVTPDAEFNFYTDPEAVSIVLRSGIPITLVPLDATMHPALRITKRLGVPVSSEAKLAQKLLDYQLKKLKETYLHDATALLYLLAPELFELRSYRILIELGERRGKISITPKGHRVKVALVDDGERIMDLIRRFLGFEI
jgi:inosine-uridine nucleoside N-ribohydrolase